MRKEIGRLSKEINHQKNFIETNKNLITKIKNANNSNKLKEYYARRKILIIKNMEKFLNILKI